MCEVSYHRANNPVNVTDPTGNILEFGNATDEDMDYIINQLLSALNSDIRLSYDSNHRVTIESGEEIIGSLHPRSVDKKIADIITSEIVTSIDISNDSEVLIGDIATGTIDLHDIDKVNQDGLTPTGTLVHEIVENHEKTKYKHERKMTDIPDDDLVRLHFKATRIENQVTGVPTNGIRNTNLKKGIMTVEKSVGKPIIIKFDPVTKNLY